jgi:hypothetical protein
MAKKARQPGKTKKNAARKPARRSADLAAALAEAAWEEADAALAEALVEFDAFQEAATRRAKADASTLLGQALSRAARRRGLLRVGKAGAVEPFDRARHAAVEPQRRAPKTVRILIPGVARGNEVLAKARVGGARARRR